MSELKKVTICHISDTHNYYVPTLDLPAADILVHSGDWSNAGKLDETLSFLNWLKKDTVRKRYKHIVVVPGNHDRWCFANPVATELLMQENGIHYLSDKGVILEGVKFYGMPWVPKYGNWGFMCTEEDIKRRCDQIDPDTQVLITHGPPKGYNDAVIRYSRETGEQGYSNEGSLELYRAIDRLKPKFHLFGHIHEGHGKNYHNQTVLVNSAIMDGNYRPVNRPLEIEIFV
jgi:Icc-related predicted phosphoesterase